MKIFLIFSQLILILQLADQAICALIKTTAAPALIKSKNTINLRHLQSIEGSMNTTISPCENFYQHACGNWDSLHTDGSKYHDYYRMIDYYTNKEMAIMLTDQAATEEPKFMKETRTFYRSCVDMKALDLSKYLKWLEENENLQTTISEVNNKDSSDKNAIRSRDWLRHLAVMNKYGLSGVFVEETYFKGLGIFKLTRPLRNGGFKTLNYKNFIVLTQLTFNWKNETLDAKWNQFSNLENDLKNLLLTNGTSRSFTMDTIAQIPWLKRYIHMLLTNTQFPATNLRILIKDMGYMTGLYKLLQAYDEEVICEYLEIRFLFHIIMNVYSKFTPEMCALKARQYMYLAMDWAFERQHPALIQSIPQIQNMFANIKRHYRKILLANPNGFNSTIMKFLLEKLNNTQLEVGHLPRTNTVQKLEAIYSNLHMNKSNYYGNQMQLLRFQTNNTLLNFIPTRNRSEYIEHTKRVSPYFHRLYNNIVLPITTLQMPIYDASLDDLYKYSSLGYILGHELTHCFDTMGTKRDPKGVKIDVYHDMINSNPKFRENLACIRQLDNAQIDEKIADVTGFRVAFQTYFELYPKARRMAVSANGMDWTLDKLFFLNHAQFRCSSTKNKRYSDKSHGTAENRIIDALSHFPEFVKTFQCPKYTDMHLEKTCQLWRRK